MKIQTHDLAKRLLEFSVRITENDILEKAEESIKIFVTRNKSAENEKKQK